MKALFSVLVLVSCLVSGCSVKTECVKGDCKNGEGEMVLPDGSKYSGPFENGRFTESGRLTLHDGRVYRGEYKGYVPHGKGTLEFPGKYKYSGEFRKGEFTGRGYLIFSDDQKLKGHTKDGVFLDGDSFGKEDLPAQDMKSEPQDKATK